MPTKVLNDQEFQVHRQREIDRRAQFAKDFPGVAGAVDQFVMQNLPPGVSAHEVLLPSQGRNDEESEMLNETNKVHRHMAEVGTIPATVVNLHPWSVVGCGKYLMYNEIPACPIGDVYALYVFRHYKLDFPDKGGRFGADPVTPIVMVNDLYNQLEGMKRGGMFGYLGDHLPGERPQSRSEEMNRWERAKKGQLALYRKLYREAEAFAHQSNRTGLRNVTEMHRLAVRWLAHYKYISAAPAWLSETVSEGEQLEACPRCGTNRNPGAFGCANQTCPYIFDPYAAYVAGELHDGHHALQRLTRAQLDELGLDYVPTAAEYRELRRQEVKGDGEDAPENGKGPRKPQARRGGKFVKAEEAAKTEEDEGTDKD